MSLTLEERKLLVKLQLEKSEAMLLQMQLGSYSS